ncbi:MAG: PilN domain-containing protein [Pseudomonadota bacterium]
MSLAGLVMRNARAARAKREPAANRVRKTGSGGWFRKSWMRSASRSVLLYRSRDEFGLFELHPGCWKEVARLRDGSKPGLQRVFLNLMRQLLPSDAGPHIRLSADYVSCHHVTVQADTETEAREQAYRSLMASSSLSGEDFWHSVAVANCGLQASTYECQVALLRKADADELDVRLQAFGLPLRHLEYADTETDTLFRLGPDERMDMRPRRPARMFFLAIAGSLAIITGLGAVDLGSKLVERSTLKSELTSLGGTPPSWSLLPRRKNRKPVPLPDLELALSGRVHTMLLIRHVNELLPVDAALTGVKIENGLIRVSGRARTIKGLLGRFAGSALLHDADFAAPTVRLSDEGVEVFSVKALIGNGARAGGGP